MVNRSQAGNLLGALCIPFLHPALRISVAAAKTVFSQPVQLQASIYRCRAHQRRQQSKTPLILLGSASEYSIHFTRSKFINGLARRASRTGPLPLQKAASHPGAARNSGAQPHEDWPRNAPVEPYRLVAIEALGHINDITHGNLRRIQPVSLPRNVRTTGRWDRQWQYSCVLSGVGQTGVAPEGFVVVGFEPVEGGIHLRIQPEPGAVLNEVSALFGIFHRAAGFHFIRPGLDFSRRFRRAVGLQPGADVFIIFRGLNGGFELLAGDALETEEQVVQRTIVMIFAGRSRQAGAAFVNGTAGDRKSGDAFARAVRGLFGQVPGNDGCVSYLCNYSSFWSVAWICFMSGCENHGPGEVCVPRAIAPRPEASAARRARAANPVPISEVGPAGHFVWRRHKSRLRSGSGPQAGAAVTRWAILILGIFIMLHGKRIVWAMALSPWGEHPMALISSHSRASLAEDAGIFHWLCAVEPGRQGWDYFSDTALTPSSGTSVHSLSGLYSFIAPAIREVFSPRLR